MKYSLNTINDMLFFLTDMAKIVVHNGREFRVTPKDFKNDFERVGMLLRKHLDATVSISSIVPGVSSLDLPYHRIAISSDYPFKARVFTTNAELDNLSIESRKDVLRYELGKYENRFKSPLTTLATINMYQNNGIFAILDEDEGLGALPFSVALTTKQEAQMFEKGDDILVFITENGIFPVESEFLETAIQERVR